MSQNCLDQSDCRDFKSSMSLKQIDEKVWIFACWYKFLEIKSWLKNNEFIVVRHECDYWSKDYKSCTAEKINGIKWFLVCSWKFRKPKSYFNKYRVVAVKNGRGLLGHETLKSTIDEMSRIFAFWYKFKEAKIYFNSYLLGMVKNGRDLLHHGVLKSNVTHK